MTPPIDQPLSPLDKSISFEGQSPIQWLNKELGNRLANCEIKNDYTQLANFRQRLEELLARIDLADIRMEGQSTEIFTDFINAAHQQRQKIKEISFQSSSAEGDTKPIDDLIASIHQGEKQRDEIISTFGNQKFEFFRSLIERQRILKGLLKMIPIETAWRRMVSEMESSLERSDVDAAQAGLEELERLYAHQSTLKRSTTIKALRRRLVQLIKNAYE